MDGKESLPYLGEAKWSHKRMVKGAGSRLLDSAPSRAIYGTPSFQAAFRDGWSAGRIASHADLLTGIEVTRPESSEKKIPDHDTCP